MERLIEMVKKYEFLYNTEDNNFKNINMKDDVWSLIAKELQIKDGKTAKHTWKKLRDCHRDSIKRQATKSGAAARNLKPWKYQEIMGFLIPFMNNRNTDTNFTACENNESIGVNSDEDLFELRSTHSPTFSQQNASPQRKRRNFSLEEYIRNAEKRREERKKEREQLLALESTPKNEMALFFESMCVTTQKLSHQSQVKIKKKIFQIITDAEDEEMNSKKSDENTEQPSVHDIDYIVCDVDINCL